MTSRRWSNLTKIIVTAALVITALVVVVTFSVMITPTIIALLLAFILGYPVNWLQRQTGWARGSAVVVVYLLLLALLALAPALIIPRALLLFSSLQSTLTDLIADLQGINLGQLLHLGNYELSPDRLLQQAGNALQSILFSTADPFALFRGVSSSVLLFVYVMVIDFWLLKDGQKLRKLALEQVPIDYQEDTRRLAAAISEIWQAFLRGQIALCVVIGFLSWIPLLIVGMPNAGGLALLTGVMEFLPGVGLGISGTISVAVALFSGSLWLPIGHLGFAIITLIIYALINQLENIFLLPRLVGGRVKLHPAVTFLATVNGAIVFGFLGVLLATPVVASARELLIYIYRKLTDQEPFEPLTPAQSGVRIRGLISGRKIEAVLFDLDGVLTPINWSAAEWAAIYFPWLDRVVRPEQRKHFARTIMISLEGMINFLINQMWRFELHKDLQHFLPLFNGLRGYPAADELLLAPGMADLLRTLAMRYRLGLISTRERKELHYFLERNKLNNALFAVTLAREDVRSILPNSEPLRLAAAHLGLAPEQLLIVSDTDTNLRAGRAMAISTAGVLSGLGREPDMLDADLILTEPADLLEWL